MTATRSSLPGSEIQQSNLVNRLPRATYRLQLSTEFGLEECASLVEYLDRLGISDLYLSPLFHARSDSQHGYDVVDHTRVEAAFGGRAALDQLGRVVRSTGLGVLLDIVPNHMGINDPDNHYWNDVLENGPNAQFSKYFDIDWDPPGCDFPGRVLLPFLGRRFGEVLEDGELAVVRTGDGFVLKYFDRQFPLTPLSWPDLLQSAIDYLPGDIAGATRDELESIIFQLRQLSTIAVSVEDRYREQFVARQRLKVLQRQSSQVTQAIDAALEQRYSDATNEDSINALEKLLSQQFYRLAYWKVAVDEINYRRFFDINDLAAIRVENPEVFESVHRLTFDLLDAGLITGLRVDHPDGLLDPAAYFEHLQTTYRRLSVQDQHWSASSGHAATLYVVVEKILSGDETLPEDWAVSGTTGYEFLNQLSEVLVDHEKMQRLQSKYAEATGIDQTPRDITYEGKQTILQDAMASELFVLASRLFRLARAHRYSYDFTLPVLQRALREYIACFPVYRTYVRPQGWDVGTIDHGHIRDAVRRAKTRNPTMSWAALEFLQDVLLLQFPKGLSEDLQYQWRQFANRLQQLTGPVTAKGLEDTAFYRYYPLASLNEVGAELGSSGSSVGSFHSRQQRRVQDWPRALSTTATHDTKRGEDVRARMHVLSEIPDRFAKQFSQWCEAAAAASATVEAREAPDANAKYLIFQTLLGTWPVMDNMTSPHPATSKEYSNRMQAYFEKAFREAKQHTSWRTPSFTFETAIKECVEQFLADPESQSFKLLDDLAFEIAGPGYVNALSQLVLKATLPGVPDFYQGTEYWSFCLVDPDNRQPVDYNLRRASLARLQADWDSKASQTLQDLTASWPDELKQFFVMQLLRMRREHTELFSSGDYHPLEVHGKCADHVIAFCRRFQNQMNVVVVPRLPYQLTQSRRTGQPNNLMRLTDFVGPIWDDTTVELSKKTSMRFHEHLTGRTFDVPTNQLRLANLFSELPFAVLTMPISHDEFL